MGPDGGTGGQGPGAGGGHARRRRETPAEARARRAAVEDPEAVLAAAARLLEARHRTVQEVRRRLTDAGYRSDLVDAAVARLADLGYLDDEEFARAWVASRDRAHPRGERALRQELARKGVARDVIDEVLAERADAVAGDRPDEQLVGSVEERRAPGRDPDEMAAEHLLERRRAALERIPDARTRRQRAYALLARSGFDAATCAEVAARFVAGTDEA
jgi:SOS response regulatory protein OraA/RecX